MDDLDYWRLCDELSIVQAALLTVGVDPSSEVGSNCEGWKMHERPFGYEAAKTGISNALRSKAIAGRLIQMPDFDYSGNQNGFLEDSINVMESRVVVESLRTWLLFRGLKNNFFLPASPETTDYLDDRNPRYAQKLAAAVRAWQAVTDPKGKSPKQAICGGQVFSDTAIGCFAAIFRSKTAGGRFPNTEWSRSLL